MKKKVTYMKFVENCVTCFFHLFESTKKHKFLIKTGDAVFDEFHIRHLFFHLFESTKKHKFLIKTGDVVFDKSHIRHLFFHLFEITKKHNF